VRGGGGGPLLRLAKGPDGSAGFDWSKVLATPPISL